jgi:polysaccharide deacetylase 2 family uncharacterized protein YibQ
VARIVCVLALVLAGCSARPATRAGPTTSSTATASTAPGSTSTTGAPAATPTTSPVHLDPDVAALPDGRGAKIAVVVDDTGIADTYLADYLKLPVTISIIPLSPHAREDDAAAHAAGHEVMLHIPLANNSSRSGVPGGVATSATPDQVDAFVTEAMVRVPHAVGANNHEGPVGSSSPPVMNALLDSLQKRGLFFMDSVTSQRTVGFALAAKKGMPPRINNRFLDHFETEADSRQALLQLARDAAASPTHGAIGICHVFHPYLARALGAVRAQLEAKGYVLSPISEVTNGLASSGLDVGVRTSIP